MDELYNYLKSIPAGPVTDDSKIGQLIVDSWDKFSGSGDQKTSELKLIGRMEDIHWDPPLLTFRIERHGALVQGSSRATIHKWTLNLDTKIATWKIVSHRQVRPIQAKFDVQPIAAELAELIKNKQHDDRLKWDTNSNVQVLIGNIIPEGSAIKDTIAGRRKRFRDALNEILNKAGWKTIRPNKYAPPA